MLQVSKIRLLLITLMFALPMAFSVSARADQGVIATVNDNAITTFDVELRIKMLKFLGERNPARLDRKVVANDLINDYVKIGEAKRMRIAPSEKELDENIKGIAANLKTDLNGLKQKLAQIGVTVGGLRQFRNAQISFSRLLQVKFKDKVEVTPADVDKAYNAAVSEIKSKVRAIEADPRRRPVKVLTLREINFPVEANDPQLLQSRAIEAGQVLQRLKSCKAIGNATSGIFNVKPGKVIEADASRLPVPLQKQLASIGVGRAIGPMRYPGGIQILAYCGSRMIVPPPVKYTLPTRDQFQNAAMNDKYSAVEKKYVAKLRVSAIIEYKDPSYVQ